jgi:hypothetical protein
VKRRECLPNYSSNPAGAKCGQAAPTGRERSIVSSPSSVVSSCS